MIDDDIELDEMVALALTAAADAGAPRPEVKDRLLARVSERAQPPAPAGFSIRPASGTDWLPHPVPGIRVRVLALNREAGYATLLVEAPPGARLPAHHHGGDEECYVLAGSLQMFGRRLNAGDFVHADAGTDHGELWTDEGCRLLLVVSAEDHLS